VLIIHVQLVLINVIQPKVYFVIIAYVNVIIQQNIGILIFKHVVSTILSLEYVRKTNKRLEQRLNYSDACVSDSDCIPTLICPQIPLVLRI
jgi:sRNA-binding regulator protein Hfq